MSVGNHDAQRVWQPNRRKGDEHIDLEKPRVPRGRTAGLPEACPENLVLELQPNGSTYGTDKDPHDVCGISSRTLGTPNILFEQHAVPTGCHAWSSVRHP